MNLGDVMDEIGDQLDTIEGLRVYRHPPDQVNPPAAIVTYPDSYVFDATFGRGSDTMELQVIVLVGSVSARASRDKLSAYVDGSGPASFKAVLEAEDYTPAAYDTVRVESVDFDMIGIAGTEYLAATFTLGIAGPGSP